MSERPVAGRDVWVDARVGVAGDMLLGALIDAGADLETVRRDVDAVLADAVAVTVTSVRRRGMRAVKLDVTLHAEDQPHRRWSDVRDLITRARLPERVRSDALRVFTRLAEAEGRVHGVAVDDVHFHEVGAWDSIADVVGVCSALESLEVRRVFASPVALGDGFVRAAHGLVPVPVPAVLELVVDHPDVVSGRPGGAGAPGVEPVGELATPTGVALLVALAEPGAATLPLGHVGSVGVGAGTKDDLPWANVVRVVVGPAAGVDAGETGPEPQQAAAGGLDELTVLSANVDDLDPRAWPDVLDGLLASGARDAWLTPILMKKGRPAHTVSALVDTHVERAVRDHLFAATSTFGVRAQRVQRAALGRTWAPVEVTCGGHTAAVRIKLGLRDGLIVRATPEYEDAADLARAARRPVAQVLRAAATAADTSGLVPGAPAP